MGMGQYIKDLAQENGLTLLDLAQQSGISVNTLYSITRRDPEILSRKTAEKIAPVLKVQIEDLTLERENKALASSFLKMMEQTGVTPSTLSLYTHIQGERLQRMLSGKTKIYPEDHAIILKGINEAAEHEQTSSEKPSDATVRPAYKPDKEQKKHIQNVVQNIKDGQKALVPLETLEKIGHMFEPHPLMTSQYFMHPMEYEKFRNALSQRLRLLSPEQLQTVVDMVEAMMKANWYDEERKRKEEERTNSPKSTKQRKSKKASK